jgi:N-acetylglucosamine kinase-like BadF-type ATPase
VTARLAVGVDAGGTSTVAALARDGTFERIVRGGPANATTRGIARAAATIGELVAELAGVQSPAALYIGAAGAGRPQVARALQAVLLAHFPGARIEVADDAAIALRAGVPEGNPGVVLVAGTGSLAYAENGERRVRVGGAGYLLGDEGSGFAIGLAAAKLLARVYDGRSRPDETTEFVARELAAPDRAALLDALYGEHFDVARIAALARGVVELASAGNRAATKIAQAAAADLGDLVKAAAQQAGLLDASPAVALAGGLLRENSLLTFVLETRLTGDIPGVKIARVADGEDGPARAALRFAQALLGAR